MTAPLRPSQEVVAGTPTHRLIRGVMRMELGSPFVERVVLHRTGIWTVLMVDTGDGSMRSTAHDTTIHILWQANEDEGWIDVNGERFRIAPGDTTSVPSGREIRLAAKMLLVQIEARSGSLDRVVLPSHGVETFEGYNRRTDYETPSAFSLKRWKITQQLMIPPSDTPYAVIDLAEPLALAWPGGADLIGRGECRVIPSGMGPVTLLPDGLGYALIIR